MPNDYWLIACIPDGESIIYLDMSEDVKAKDILLNGNWEDDCITPYEKELPAGVYKFKLIVTGGRYDYDPYEYWINIDLELLETLWQLPQ